MKPATSALCTAIALSAGLAGPQAYAQEFTYDQEAVERGFQKPSYSPYAGRKFPTEVLWGDTHLHTRLSGDARGFGCIVSPDDAYRLARGEEITASTGITNSTPLLRPSATIFFAWSMRSLGMKYGLSE